MAHFSSPEHIFQIKMKFSIIFCIATVCVSVSHPAPAVPKQLDFKDIKSKIEHLRTSEPFYLNGQSSILATDWARVTALATVIQNDANSLFENIKTTTGNAEESLKDRIFAKVDAANSQTDDLLRQIGDLINDQTLSRKHAKYLEAQLIQIFDNLLENLQDELEQLSTVIANMITNLITNAKTDMSRLSEELYLILPIDWNAVRDAGKGILVDVMQSSFVNIEKVAIKDNEQVGKYIKEKMDYYFEGFYLLYKVLEGDIEDQIVDEKHASDYIYLIGLYYQVFIDDVSYDLENLNPAAADRIQNILNLTLSLVKFRGSEFVAHLRR